MKIGNHNSTNLLMLLCLASSSFLLGHASEAPEDEEADAAECYPAFDKTYTDEFYEATKQCLYKPMPKILKENFEPLIFREIKNPFKRMNVESVKVRTAQECHFMCFTFSDCKSFRFESIPQKADCDPEEVADCNASKCKLLTDEVVNKKGIVDKSGKFVYGEKELCTESVSQAAKEYFFDKDTRYHAAKDDFINARNQYNGTVEDSIHHYSYLATNCIGPAITKGIITEKEMGVAQSVKNGKLPWQPTGDYQPTRKTVTVNVKDFCCM